MSYQPTEHETEQDRLKVNKVSFDESTPLIVNSSRQARGEETPTPTFQNDNKIYRIMSHRVIPLLLILLVSGLSAYLILLPIVIQKVINISKIDLIATNISRPTNTTFQIGLQAKLITPISFPIQARTKPTKVNLKYRNTVIGYTTIPEMTIYGGGAAMDIEDQFVVVDESGLSEFASDLIQSEKLSWFVEGLLQVSVLGKTYSNLYLNKLMQLKGMNGLEQVEVEGIHIPANSPFGGVKVDINATIINPTSNTLAINSVVYELHYNQVLLGEFLANNLILHPNRNQLNLRGRLYTQTNPYKLEVLGEFVTKYLTGKPLVMQIKGSRVIPSVNWLDAAIKNHQVEITYTKPKKSQFVKAIQLDDLFAQFDVNSAYRPLTSSHLTATLESPFDFPFQIESVSEDFYLYRQVGDGYDKLGARLYPMAKLMIPPSNLTTTRTNNTIQLITQFEAVPLLVEPNLSSRWNFENFLTELIFGNGTSLLASGYVDAHVLTSIGLLRISKLPTELQLKFPGLNGFLDPPPSLSDLVVTGASNGRVNFKATLHITNPSPLSVSLGSLLLDLVYSNVTMGTVQLIDFHLQPHTVNSIIALGTFDLPRCRLGKCTLPNDLIRQQFLTYYTTGKPLDVVGLGSFRTTPISSLKPSLAKLDYPLTIPSVSEELLKSSKYSFFGGGVQLDLTNPFASVSIQIVALNVTSFKNTTVLAQIQLDSQSSDPKLNPAGILPILLPPATSVQTKWLPVKLIGSTWSLLWDALGGSITLDNKVEALVTLNNDSNTLLNLSFSKDKVLAKVGF